MAWSTRDGRSIFVRARMTGAFASASAHSGSHVRTTLSKLDSRVDENATTNAWTFGKDILRKCA